MPSASETCRRAKYSVPIENYTRECRLLQAADLNPGFEHDHDSLWTSWSRLPGEIPKCVVLKQVPDQLNTSGIQLHSLAVTGAQPLCVCNTSFTVQVSCSNTQMCLQQGQCREAALSSRSSWSQVEKPLLADNEHEAIKWRPWCFLLGLCPIQLAEPCSSWMVAVLLLGVCVWVFWLAWRRGEGCGTGSSSDFSTFLAGLMMSGLSCGQHPEPPALLGEVWAGCVAQGKTQQVLIGTMFSQK